MPPADIAAAGIGEEERSPPRPRSGRVRLRLVDGFAIEIGGASAPALGAKARALVALLAVSPDGAVRRSALAALLWSEARGDRARAALRQCLRGALCALEPVAPGLLGAGRDALVLDLRRLDVDVLDIAAAARAGAPHPLLLSGRDPFAAAGAVADDAGAAFSLVLTDALERVRAETREALERAWAAAGGRARDDLALMRDIAAALAALDPLDERAARRLIRACAALGDRDGAASAYDALWRRLDAEADAEPSRETRDALDAALAIRPDAPPPDAPPPSVPRLRISPPVAEPAMRAAAETARLDLADRLARFAGWTVALSAESGPADLVLRLAIAGEGGRRSLLAVVERRRDDVAIVSARARIDGPEAEAQMAAAAARIATALRAEAGAERGPAPALPPATDLRAAIDYLPPEHPDPEPAPLSEALLSEGARPGPAQVARLRAAAETQAARAPLEPGPRLALAWCALFDEEPEEASASFALALALNPADPLLVADAALGFALSGAKRDAEHALAASAALGAGAAPGCAARIALARLILGPAEAGIAAAAALDDPPLMIRAARAAAEVERGAPSAGAAALSYGSASLLRPADAAALAAALPGLDASARARFEAALAAAIAALR